ncbi:Sodium/hydrogen exchanger 3 [Taenia crassiceps]|uniref:Sodium/hydrogen exchanger n=1 Tax=Taenia crassiceps TaxID=6207 RepID=A0ABR4Q2Z5_9CEST
MDVNLTGNLTTDDVEAAATIAPPIYYNPLEKSPWSERDYFFENATSLNAFRPPYSLSLLAAWQPRHAVHYISVLLIITTVLLLRVFNMVIRRLVTTTVPESLVAICVGVGIGWLFKTLNSPHCCLWVLTPTLFFMILLPFCIFDASYNLYNRAFGDCIGAIIVYALCATVLNMIIIGCLLVGAEIAGIFKAEGLVFGTQVLMLYASLIVAVDPVAVLMVFHEIGVDPNLYFLVLGESLLNDAVTVVLYKIVVNFLGRDDVTTHDILIGIAAFFIINAGGILVGLVCGVISCLMTRIRTHLEIVYIFAASYAAYLLSDVLGWSGLVAMITSGMIQSSYAFHNLSEADMGTCRTVARMLADLSESVTFLLIGVHVTSGGLHWHTSFILYQLIVCLVVRAMVVYALTWCLNRWDVNYVRISITEQFVLAYGGLRGAVALSLVYMVDPKLVDRGQKGVHATLITATLFTILFTVALMGPTMKPLVRLLRVKLASKRTISLMRELNERIIDELNSGVEAITGHMGRNRLRTWFQRVDEKYVRLVLQNTPEFRNQKIIKVYEDMALVLHQASLDPKRADLIMEHLPTSVKAAYHAQRLADKVEALRQLRRSALRRGSRYPPMSVYDYQHMIDEKRRELMEMTAPGAVPPRLPQPNDPRGEIRTRKPLTIHQPTEQTRTRMAPPTQQLHQYLHHQHQEKNQDPNHRPSSKFKLWKREEEGGEAVKLQSKQSQQPPSAPSSSPSP